jgi:hypothetical protein
MGGGDEREMGGVTGEEELLLILRCDGVFRDRRSNSYVYDRVVSWSSLKVFLFVSCRQLTISYLRSIAIHNQLITSK